MPAAAQKESFFYSVQSSIFSEVLHLLHERSNNLEIKNSYLLLNASADKPLVDSWEVCSNVAFRAGAVCTLLHSLSGSAAPTRQTEAHGKTYSADSLQNYPTNR